MNVGSFGGNKNVLWASLVAQLVKKLHAMHETWIQSLSWEDPLEKGTEYPLQYSAPENSTDCIVHGVTKTRTQLSSFHLHKCFVSC